MAAHIMIFLVLSTLPYTNKKKTILTALGLISLMASTYVLGGSITKEIQEQALACEEACFGIYNGTMTYEEAWWECDELTACKLEYCSQFGDIDGARNHCGFVGLD